MKFARVAFCVSALLCAALTASAQTIEFNKDKAGEPPKGFSTALTGQGKAGVWVVMKDDASPGQGNVLAQTDADATGYRFPLCVEVEDGTFTEAGKVGLWTKADSAPYFDDLKVVAQ